MKKDGLAPPPAARAWTRIDDYLVHMRRRDAASRRRTRLPPRTQPETPRFMLSTFPFVALIAIFAVMTIAMMIVAWPGKGEPARQRQAAHEIGTAPRGWFQEAKRDMRCPAFRCCGRMFIHGQSAATKGKTMLLGLPVALAALAQSASGVPAAAQPAGSTTVPAAQPVPDGCRSTRPDADSRVIVVCGQRPQGYRIDPDVIQARREARNHARPKPPETMKDNPCETVGPMGCRGGGGVDLVSAGLVAAQMLARAAKGENVGKMFVTDPQLSEYQLYQQARKEREEKEAEAAAKAKSAAARAARTADPGATSPPSSPTP